MTGTPIIPVGSTQRCGTTLLQRLFNATRRAVIFGENFYFLQTLPGSIRKLHIDAQKRADATAQYRSLLTDTSVDFEASSLFPDYMKYLEVTRSGFYAICQFYQAQAAEMGFSRWGLKHQIIDTDAFRFTLQLMPDARYIGIYRNPIDVAKSAKTRWPDAYQALDAFRSLGQRWRDNTLLLHQMAGQDNAILLRYENFIADPDPHLRAIEEHTAFPDLDRRVLTNKVNDHPHVSDGTLQNVYQAPAHLTDQEQHAVLAAAGDMVEKLGYSIR